MSGEYAKCYLGTVSTQFPVREKMEKAIWVRECAPVTIPTPKRKESNIMETGAAYINAALICEKVLQERDSVLSVVRIIDRLTVTVAPDEAPKRLHLLLRENPLSSSVLS
jgi:hypothetical protein